MKKEKRKTIMLMILSIVFVSIAVGVTYAFFNYTRTGSENTIRTGRIYFHTDQDSTINLTNVFPVASSSVVSNSSNTVTVDIEGDTTYSGGIEYLVTIDEVANPNVPVNFKATVNNLGTSSNTYWDSRGGNAPIYALREEGIASENEHVMVGYIPAGSEGVDGSISITAYVDIDNVAISDTYSRIVNNNLVIGETTSEWALGRTVVTTDEWNSLTSSNPLSFKIKVEANEGIWVEKPNKNVLANLNSNSNWTGIRGTVTSIEFSTSSEVPSDAITSFDATDITSEGTVTLYTLDDGLGNNTYRAVICADGEIYAPANSTRLFFNIGKLTSFNGSNFKVDNVTNMNSMFLNDSALVNITGLQNWSTSNVTDMGMMFGICRELTNVDFLINFDVSNVLYMNNMFRQCKKLQNVNGLINWNTESVIDMDSMFDTCQALQNINGLINWNTASLERMNCMFYGCLLLQNTNGLTNWNTGNVEFMENMFYGCSSLTDLSGLEKWDVSNVTTMYSMFCDCDILVDFTPLGRWNTESVEDMSYMIGMNPGKIKTGNPIIDFSALSAWDVSSVTNMTAMFLNINIASYKPFKNWDVSSVELFFDTFNQTTSSIVTTLDGLENWNVSSATNMVCMFAENVNLIDASAINNWNINANINFEKMFYNTPVHPEFTRVSGTWNNEGTFTPTSS